MCWTSQAEYETKRDETVEARQQRWERERAESIATYEGKEDAYSILACLRAMERQYDREDLEERIFPKEDA